MLEEVGPVEHTAVDDSIMVQLVHGVQAVFNGAVAALEGLFFVRSFLCSNAHKKNVYATHMHKGLQPDAGVLFSLEFMRLTGNFLLEGAISDIVHHVEIEHSDDDFAPEFAEKNRRAFMSALSLSYLSYTTYVGLVAGMAAGFVINKSQVHSKFE